MLNTPVLFLIFNRPDLTEKVFSVIKQVQPKQLFIAADGPREDKPGEVALCAETRKTVMDMIDWDCEVHTLFREKNLGCKIAVSAAITWFFENVEDGIILEDDCLPDISFFNYCSELLSHYRTDRQVNFISGTCLPGCADHVQESYFFSKFSVIWGWATWRRVWEKYDVNMKDWKYLKNSNWIDNVFYGNLYFSNGFRKILSSIENGFDTWDFQLFFLNLKENSFNIHPSKNLISNIGFGNIGTHTLHKTEYSEMLVYKIGTLIHPKVKSFDYIADSVVFNYLYKYDPYQKNKLKILYDKIVFRIRKLI